MKAGTCTRRVRVSKPQAQDACEHTLDIRGCACVRQRILRVCRATGSPIMPSQNSSSHVPSSHCSIHLQEVTHDASTYR